MFCKTIFEEPGELGTYLDKQKLSLALVNLYYGTAKECSYRKKENNPRRKVRDSRKKVEQRNQ